MEAAATGPLATRSRVPLARGDAALLPARDSGLLPSAPRAFEHHADALADAQVRLVGVEIDDALQGAHVVELARLQQDGAALGVPVGDAPHLARPAALAGRVVLDGGALADGDPAGELL